MKILVVNPGELPIIKEIDSTLESMQDVVGGLIQALYPFDEPVALICNDEAQLLNLPMCHCLHETGDGDIIQGSFFVCGAPPEAERFASLTDEQIQRYEKRFHFPELFFPLGNGHLAVLTDQ